MPERRYGTPTAIASSSGNGSSPWGSDATSHRPPVASVDRRQGGIIRRWHAGSAGAVREPSQRHAEEGQLWVHITLHGFTRCWSLALPCWSVAVCISLERRQPNPRGKWCSHSTSRLPRPGLSRAKPPRSRPPSFLTLSFAFDRFSL